MRKSNVPTLLEIKQMSRNETSGKKIMPRFYDFMEGNDDYMFNLEECKEDWIQRMIGTIVQNILELDSPWVKLERTMFLQSRKDHFFHGQFLVQNRLASFFYFDDIAVGCLAITPPMGKEAPMIYARFDGATLNAKKN